MKFEDVQTHNFWNAEDYVATYDSLTDDVMNGDAGTHVLDAPRQRMVELIAIGLECEAKH